MTRGLTREQVGMTEEMIEAYGERVFELSHNIQVRRRDPIRELDWDQIEAQREGMGIADGDIAERLGLTIEQVTFIRLVMERRKFNRRNYHRLYELGGGRRFRKERYVAHRDRFSFRPEAVELRKSLDFDPRLASRHLRMGAWNADTTTTWLTRWAEKTPEKTAVIAPDGTSFTYAEMHEKAHNLATSLLDLGIRRGDVVAIQLPNTVDFLTAYFGVTMMGGILSTLHMPYRAGEMEPFLIHGSARAVICGAATDNYDAPATMLDLAAQVPTLEHVIVSGGTAPDGTLSFADMAENGGEGEIDNPAVASDPAILCFTSGTSSSPKAVVHTYQTLLSNNRMCASLYNLTSDDIVLSGPPFTHAFGICVINLSIMEGSTAVLMPQFTPDVLADIVTNHKPTVLFVAPAHVAAGLKSGAFENCDFSSVRSATISGSACPYELARDFDALLPNGNVGQMWGMTESFMGLVTPFDGPAEMRQGTLGLPTPAVDFRIVDGDGNDCPAGEEGEIQIRGASVVPAYFNNEQANRQSFGAGGWFSTGDLAIQTEDGYVRITGRVKDIINRGGIKINPVDVEAVIDQHPAVMQSAIAPMADPVLGEKACVFVVPRDGASVTLEEICAFLDENGVAKMKWPERLEIIAEMPMTPTRKIIKAELTKQLAAA